jgi:drug/metabolite transporter (DMT)-like permease
MSIPRTTGWGIALAGGTALISGVSIFINGLVVKSFPDPVALTGARNALVGLVLVGILVATGGLAEVRALDRRRGTGLVALAVIGGSIPFILFFSGLAQATGPGAAFIHKTLFIWVAILAVPLLGERLGLVQIGALAVLLVGQALILTPAGVTWGTGETMIATATLLWAVETMLAKRLLGSVPPAIVGAGRLGFGLVVLVGYLAVTGSLAAVASLSLVQWGWVLLTGLLLSGYVGTWFAALRRAPASLVTAVLVLGAPVTAGLQLLQTGHLPATPALAGQLLVLAAGGALVAQAIRRWRPATAQAAVESRR